MIGAVGIRASTVALGLAALTVGGLLPVQAAAAERVVFWPFRGTGGEQVQALVARQLGGYAVVPAEVVRRAAVQIGARPGSARSLAALAQRLSARAIVQGVVIGREPWEVQITVRNATDGSRLGTVVWTGDRRASLIRDIAGDPSPRVRSLVEQARPLPRRSLADRRGVRDRDWIDSKPPRTRGRSGRTAGGITDDALTADDDYLALGESGDGAESEAFPLLTLGVGPRSVSRSFTLSDNLSRIPGYRLPMAGAVGGEATLFPGARTQGFFAHLGLAGRWESSLGATSRSAGATSPTKNESYLLGGRGRVPLGAHTLLLGFDYGRHRFELEVPEDRLSPSVDYLVLRPSLAGRLALGAGVSLSLETAYLHVLSADGLGDAEHFPRLEARGVEADLRVGIAVHRDWELSVGVDVRHYGHVFNPLPGDRWVAGGATDQFLGGMALLTYVVR